MANIKEELDIHIWGSGCTGYNWYEDLEYTVEGWLVSMESPDDDGSILTKEIFPSDLIDAAAQLLTERKYAAVGDDGTYTRRGLADLVALAWDDVDIDADVADLIVQTAMYGDVVYG